MLVRGMLVGEKRKRKETTAHVNKIKARRNLKRRRRGERGQTILERWKATQGTNRHRQEVPFSNCSHKEAAPICFCGCTAGWTYHLGAAAFKIPIHSMVLIGSFLYPIT